MKLEVEEKEMTYTQMLVELSEKALNEKNARLGSLHIGDTIYTIDIKDKKTIHQGAVENIARWDLDNSVVAIRIWSDNGSYVQYRYKDFEKDFFFEKEQAEEYLKQAKR